jgi:hypothetical protein
MFNTDGQERDNIWDLSKPRITVHPNDALKDLKAYALFLKGKPVTASGYNKWGKYSQDTIRRLFDSWEKACMEAQIKNCKKHKYTAEELIAYIDTVTIYMAQQSQVTPLAVAGAVMSASLNYFQITNWGKLLKKT